MKIINQNDTPQHRSPTDFNDTSTASCALQIDEGKLTKELILDPRYSSDIIQDYLEDNNRNIQYEKRNGKAFTCSYKMNLPRIAGFISTTNWDEVP